MKPQKYQVWKSQNPLRFVVVTQGADAHGCVEIVTVCRSREKLWMPEKVSNGRLDYASDYRFNGTASGYTFVANSIKEFNDRSLNIMHYARQLARKSKAAALPLLAPVAPVLNVGAISIMALPEPGPKVGEIWRELKGTIMRFVQVVAAQKDGKVQIVTRYATELAGYRADEVAEAKPTFAKVDRFNGKKGGYEFVSANLSDLIESGLLSQRFVPAGETLESVLKTAFPLIAENQLWHEVGDETCFHLIKIVGFNVDEVEVTTSYVANSDPASKKVTGKTQVLPIEAFAANAKRFQLANAA